MKTKKLNKKLTLSKVSVANLNSEMLTNVRGGVLTLQITCGDACDTDFTCGDETYCGGDCRTISLCHACG